VKPMVGIFQMMHYRGLHPGIAELLLLDGNAALADVDLDACSLVPFLVELIAQDHGGDGERADDEVENVAIHHQTVLFCLVQVSCVERIEHIPNSDPPKVVIKSVKLPASFKMSPAKGESDP
jgi:hypothetical protein